MLIVDWALVDVSFLAKTFFFTYFIVIKLARLYVNYMLFKQYKPSAMINTTQLVLNLAIMSFIDTLVSYNYNHQQNINYGGVAVYIEPGDLVLGDLADHIVSAATSRYYAPVILIDSHRKLKPFRRSRGENNLNIILFRNQSSIDYIQNIRRNIYGNEHKLVILVSEEDSSDEQFSANFTQPLLILNRFVLIRYNQDELLDFNLHESVNNIMVHPINMFNTTSVISAVDKVYGRRLINLNGRPLRVFTHFAPKWGMIIPVDESNMQFVLQGPDVLVTDIIIPHLNATAIITTDVIQEDPNFRTWFDGHYGFLQDYRFRYYHKESFGRTLITDFNARL